MIDAADSRPLIMHVVHAFDVGGLENGVVNLINHMPRQHYRHAVVALTQISAFKDRIRTSDVAFVSLNKRPGHGVRPRNRAHAKPRRAGNDDACASRAHPGAHSRRARP